MTFVMLSLTIYLNGIILDPKEAQQQAETLRWSAEKASKLETKLSRIRGANYLASNCVNTTQMWEQFDSLEELIDRELGYSQKAGLNSIRVFIQYIVYEAYPDELVQRFGRLLDIADSHNISVMPTLFDDCWRPEPQLGEQPKPTPGVHNCCWTSSPGEKRTNDPTYYPKLAEYVKALVSTYRTDERVVAWESYNEPNRGKETLLPLAFMWARECDPVQPLVTCFAGNKYSDLITDHQYENPSDEKIKELKAEDRPVMVTECLARPKNNLADFIPVYERHKVGWYIWEAMIGADQTRFPWGSKPNSPEPEVPFHGLIYPDGKPYSQDEVNLILRLAERQEQQSSRLKLNLSRIHSPIILEGDSTTAFRDPAAIYYDGVFRLFHTLVRKEEDGHFYWYLAVTKSRDLIHWTEPKILTPKDRNLNFCGPGNIVHVDDHWILCLSSYPYGGNDTARIWTMESKELVSWSKPKIMMVKGPDVTVEKMGRIIDPYLFQDKDNPNKWWCFYKQNGVSMSYTYDFKTWAYFGRIDGGENSCVLTVDDKYILFHSPSNGIGIKKSKDLEQWEDVRMLYLGQKDWSWAQGRITAGFVLNLRDEPGIGKYIMFFHGSSKEGMQMLHTHGHANIALAWSDDLVNWKWPK